jgi:arylsulfatase B
MSLLLLFLTTIIVISCLFHPSTAANKPHLIIILADDFGWGNIGIHAGSDNKEVQTPNMNALAASGILLDRFYTYKICSPTRSTLQSGRLPVHVNMHNYAPETFNPKDLVSGYAAIPRNMTCIAERLKQEGYRTVGVGKWDAGMATPRHTPKGRGYGESLMYFHHANDYWTCGLPLTAVGEVDVCYNRFLDLWENDKPAKKLAGTKYEEEVFFDYTYNAIQNHDPSKPLFLFHSFHLIHTPLQVPQDVLDKFAYVDYPHRQLYAAMVYYADDVLGRIVQALKDKNMWDNTLLLFFSDNGGPVYNPGSASNYPQRGGKYNDFEGGVRVNAFLAGGKIPSSKRGSINGNLMHAADVYGMFLRIAHFGFGDVSDEDFSQLIKDGDAAGAGLPPVDSIDVWPVIGGNGGNPKRTEIHLSPQAILRGKYKLVVGEQPQDIWTGPRYPNATGKQPLFPDASSKKQAFTTDCGPAGCLFDVFADPTEHHDLSAELPELRKELLDRLAELNKSIFNPDRGEPQKQACRVASLKWKGFYGPFLQLNDKVSDDLDDHVGLVDDFVLVTKD